ncbi:MAG: methylated-DNA--[protein]-cysteine S-methyltransferase [Dehalococcoidia bacterium]|nr:methylated-DNA--[protein]-cysteine S-methyltransferase [Dehalococcoidia bacterium]
MLKLNYLIFDTSLGWVGMMGSVEGLRELTLPQPSPQQAFYLLHKSALKSQRILIEARVDYFGDLAERIESYFNGERVNFPDRLDLSWASPFKKKVWKITQAIPYGETRAYAWVANKMDMYGAARAVGQALARNPLPIIIPCHRVICSDGTLGGFSDGKLLKQRLLEMEAKFI